MYISAQAWLMEHQSLNVPVAMTETLMEFELAELIPLETLQWYRPAWELKIAFFLREVYGVFRKIVFFPNPRQPIPSLPTYSLQKIFCKSSHHNACVQSMLLTAAILCREIVILYRVFIKYCVFPKMLEYCALWPFFVFPWFS